MKTAFRTFLFLLFLVIFITPSWAVTKAWLIGAEKAIKLNVETNTIEKEDVFPIRPLKIFFDLRRGNLFVLYSPRRFEGEIAVHDIKTLKPKGKLDIVIDLVTEDDLQLIFPSSGNLFYLRGVKEEDGTPEIIAYDATTLKPLNRYTTSPPTTNKLMLSAAGDTLYSIVQSGNIIKIDSFQTSDFSYKSSIDIKNFFTLGTEGGVSEYQKEKLLVSEVISRTPQFEYFEYIYDIPTNKITQKIRTTIKGPDFLIPAINKIALHERQYIGRFKSMRLETDYKSSGKIHIFDALTGKKDATVKVNVEQNGDFLCVTPSEDKMYFLSYGAGFINPMLHIIDLKTYFVIKTLPMPEAHMTMVFFEE